jgi:cytokinin dehydrogenase
MERRRFLVAATILPLVVGLDQATGRWVSASEKTTATTAPLPPLDGVVVTDDKARTDDSSDEGNIVHRLPWAVLRPGSVDDVAKMIRYCRQYAIPVAARGEAHTVYGQSLVDNGLVVETRWLDTIHSISADISTADVDAGVLWKSILKTAVNQGLTPPVFTGYIELTVGGTLSVGGISTDGRQGAQVDNVRALQVVTGAGDIVWCDETSNADLFHGVLAGLGQLGIITRAEIDLTPAPTKVRQWSLVYADPHAFFRDLRTVLARGEFEHVYGQIAMPAFAVASDPSPLLPPVAELLPLLEQLTSPVFQGIGSVVTVPPLPLPTPWLYLLNLGKYYEPGHPPSSLHHLRGMSDLFLLRQQNDRTYSDYVLRVDALINLLEGAGLWNGVPRPWIDVFLPGQAVEDFVIDTFNQLTFDDLGLAGFGLLFPQRKQRLTRPYFRVPESQTDWVYLFDVLTSAPLPGPNEAFVESKLERNRGIYERARAAGGTLYPISAVPMQPADWAHQYGPRYTTFRQLKQQFDPDGILTPGLRIFG